jgi:hypothetical protein
MAFPGAVWIDRTAAGYGWFIDPTVADDSAFPAAPGSPAYGKVDLLTVVEHELGHVLGLEDTTEDGLMGIFLGTGVRRVPAPESAAEASPARGSLLPGVQQPLIPVGQAGAELDHLLGMGQAPPDGAWAVPAGGAPGQSGQTASLASAAQVLLTLDKSSNGGVVATPAHQPARDRLPALDAAFAADPESLWPEAG